MRFFEFAPNADGGEDDPMFNPETFYDIPKLKAVAKRLAQRSVNYGWYDLQLKVLIKYMSEPYIVKVEDLEEMFPTAPEIVYYIERNIIKAWPSNEPPYIIKNPNYKPRAPQPPKAGLSEEQRMRMADYLKRADELHDKMMLAQQRGDEQTWQRLKQEYEKLEAQARQGMVAEEQLDELMFKGSPCTVDCSGHRAGYEWWQRKRRTPMSWSQSFNNGAAIAASGK